MSSTLDNSKMEEGTTKTSSDGRRQFKLTRRIGLGGFGEVYLAEMSTPTGFTKTVALKLLRSDVEGAGDNARRMRDEARLLGLLRHRAIVQADDLITVDGRTAVVMEFVPGANLSDLLNEQRFTHPLPANLGIEIAAELADAMDAAWSRPSSVTQKPLEVLHRDIKPGNVRITPDGEIKILDFGIARADQMDRETATRDYAVGSLPYMAPELLVGQGASPASDMYALGVTLIETMTRSRFGIAQDTQEAHSSRVEERLAAAHELTPELSPCREELEALIRGMLSFSASARPKAPDVAKRLHQMIHALHLSPIKEWAREWIDQVQLPANIHEPEGVSRDDMSGRIFFEDIASKADTWDGDTLGLTKSDVDRARAPGDDKSWVWKTALIALLGLVAVLGYRLLQDDEAPEPVVHADRGPDGGAANSDVIRDGGDGDGPGRDRPDGSDDPTTGGGGESSASLGDVALPPEENEVDPEVEHSLGSEGPNEADSEAEGRSTSETTGSSTSEEKADSTSGVGSGEKDSPREPTTAAPEPETPSEEDARPAQVKFASTPTMRIEIELDGVRLKTPHKQELAPGSYRLVCDPPQEDSFSDTIVIPAGGGVWTWTCNTSLRKVTGS
jgi:serine/threonine protein kinase